MHTGSLYLIPTTLSAADQVSLTMDTIPERTKKITAALRTFIVEDAKSARRFLKHLPLEIPLQQIQFFTLNHHTAESEIAHFIQPILAGEDVGLLSEAGCPAVADPGANLIALAQRQQIKIVPLVGPSSILLALMASGMNGQRFKFCGYLPIDRSQRIQTLQSMEAASRLNDETQIFIETPYRNQPLFSDILHACDAHTELCLAINLTLPDEVILNKTIAEWRMAQSSNAPDWHKKPAIFLLYSRSLKK